jgi:hypothetical protein
VPEPASRVFQTRATPSQLTSQEKDWRIHHDSNVDAGDHCRLDALAVRWLTVHPWIH